MSPWAWHWRHADDDNFSYAGDFDSREAAISDAHRELKDGDPFNVIEARMSEAAKYEGSDSVPFLRTRNRELLTVAKERVDV